MGNLFFLEDTDILGESLLKSGFQIHFSSVSLVSYAIFKIFSHPSKPPII